MIEVTVEQVKSAVKAALTEKGEDFLYVNPFGQPMRDEAGYHTGASCFYVHGDVVQTPGCFVGNVLHRLGVSLEYLTGCEHMRAGAVIASLEVDNVLKMSFASRQMLVTIQSAQDSGKTWGEAVKAAQS